MRYGFDEKNMQPRLILEKNDLDDAFKIKSMMQHPGWKTLEKYYEATREEFFKTENKWILDKDKHSMIQILTAKRSGYDDGFALAEMVVARADKQMEREVAEKNNFQSDLKLNIGGV
jgi:hypothetical protein